MSHSPSKNTTGKHTKQTQNAIVKAEPLQVVTKTEKQTESQLLISNQPTKPVVTAENTALLKKAKTTSSNTISSKNIKSDKAVPVELSFKKPIKSIERILNQNMNAGDDDGLSLFWIVILVLLILFIFGAVDGSLGGLIYILLVVALVLLILWLLKVL